MVGGDVPWHVDVTEEEGARGVTKQVKYWRAMPCPRCVGTGGDPRTALNLCSRCNGVGAASRSRKPGSNAKKSLCTFCTGRGKIPTILCPRCKGRSVLYEEHVESIQIPAGTEDGTILKVPGAGHRPSPDIIPGNLLLLVGVSWVAGDDARSPAGGCTPEFPPVTEEWNILANLPAQRFMDFEEICAKMGITSVGVAQYLDVQLRMLEVRGQVLVEIQRGKVMYRKS